MIQADLHQLYQKLQNYEKFPLRGIFEHLNIKNTFEQLYGKISLR
jgi:hypothetical protein